MPIRLARRTFALWMTLALAAVPPAAADPRPRDMLDAAELRLAIRKIGVTGSALYVAAHPDDENTALLAWLSKGRMVRTAYLSMTRGDGGQNLIGPEQGDRLGLIRTHELLAARRIDGAEQFFTRAIDFGYSKKADETLAFWDRERTLADVVWVIRRFRPDVIVTRFPATGEGGHGHHTASSILAEQAFEAAADSTRFPEQLRLVRPWRARRLVWNVFRFGSQGADTNRIRLRVDLGAYQTLLARSFTEISGESRSQHKSQGFGAAERRGEWVNTFEHRLGEPATQDLFEGVGLTWARVPGAGRLPELLHRAEREFDPDRPQKVLPVLFEAYDILAKLPQDVLVRRKRDELMEVIRSCAGLWLEAIAQSPYGTPGGRAKVVASALLRADVPVTLERAELFRGEDLHSMGRPASPSAIATGASPRPLALNRAVTDTLALIVPPDLEPSRPYWLRRQPSRGAYDVPDPAQIGDPEGAPALVVRITLGVAGRRLAYEVPVVYRWVDPVAGERHRSFDVVPPVSLRMNRNAYLFPDRGPRTIVVTAQSTDAPVQGQVRLVLPEGWRCDPAEIPVALAASEADTAVNFRVTPPAAAAVATVRAEMRVGDRAYASRLVRIDYAHVGILTVLPAAESRLVRADLECTSARVAYLMGSGDEVPNALEQMGLAVELLSDDQVEAANLSGYDAIVVGVRAYNTRPRLRRLQRRLLDYVAAGGRLVVQYQTADPGLDDRLGPFPFKISRDRVTVEEAPMTATHPEHALLTSPNTIGAPDFDDWVQERGLYFANPWDPRYETVLGCADPGEPPRGGGLLFARHGKGVFIYTGYAWFRQLPAGVPGAYRLFANLVSRTR